jgi:UPF0755 protein
MSTKKKKFQPYTVRGIRILYITLLCLLTVFSVSTVLILKAKEFALDTSYTGTWEQKQKIEITKAETFPLGVFPQSETITENPKVDSFFETHLSYTQKGGLDAKFTNHALAILARFSWFQSLASPISRILVIEAGERKEQIATNFGEILNWSDDQKNTFLILITGSAPQIEEGKFFPGRYVVQKDASPEDIARLLVANFQSEVLSHYPLEISKVVPLQDALIIASLLEREAYDFEDMRYISGIIWNRLFSGMNLQLDASLQYAKANESNESWWPQVIPKDKYIDSPFNTYENEGLPPSPIANPSGEAILASLNPKQTDCIFYFHDQDGGFHCTTTYEEHVALLKQYYGRGK